MIYVLDGISRILLRVTSMKPVILYCSYLENVTFESKDEGKSKDEKRLIS